MYSSLGSSSNADSRVCDGPLFGSAAKKKKESKPVRYAGGADVTVEVRRHSKGLSERSLRRHRDMVDSLHSVRSSLSLGGGLDLDHPQANQTEDDFADSEPVDMGGSEDPFADPNQDEGDARTTHELIVQAAEQYARDVVSGMVSVDDHFLQPEGLAKAAHLPEDLHFHANRQAEAEKGEEGEESAAHRDDMDIQNNQNKNKAGSNGSIAAIAALGGRQLLVLLVLANQELQKAAVSCAALRQRVMQVCMCVCMCAETGFFVCYVLYD